MIQLTFRPRLILLSIFLVFGIHSLADARQHSEEEISGLLPQDEIEFHIQFLASDEFLGRDTGTQELQIASRYLSSWFQRFGVQPAPGHDSYFQNVPFQRLPTPEAAEFVYRDSVFTLNTHLLTVNSVRDQVEAPVIFLDHATEAEIEQHGVEGKIVISNAGLPGQSTPQQFRAAGEEKRQWVKDAGGVALIELYSNTQFPWQVLVNFLGGDSITLMDEDYDEDASSSDEEQILHLWMDGTETGLQAFFEERLNETGVLTAEGDQPERFYSRNVVGVIEGTDPDLKDEYLLLGAHYDHIGVVDGHPEPITGEYIYNGARDNAVGTAGVLSAAKYFAKNPPKRSVLLAAWTAEERGLLGSGYFADNPMVPLEQIIYKLNIDGAGYNDTTKVTVIGLGRTEADDEMKAAAESFGLEAIPDPVPEQNLFDRSDNVHFARRGIPAPTYSMGLTDFDDEINHYYHQTTDEPDTLSYDYIAAYIRSFVLAAGLIADRDEAPFWLPGDVYEEAGQELYELETQ